MVSVVVVHSVAWMNLDHPIAAAVYPALDRFMRFGVPIFVFLTSYVLVHTLRNRPLQALRFTRGRVERVVVPFLSWVVIYLAAYVLLRMVSIDSPSNVLKLLWDGTVAGHLYFLGVACQFYLLFLALPRSRRGALLLCAVAVPLQLTLSAARAAGWHVPPPFDIVFGQQAQWFFVWWIGYYAVGALAAWYREPLLRGLRTFRPVALLALAVTGPLALIDMTRAGAQGYDQIFRPATLLLTLAVVAALLSLAPRPSWAGGGRLEVLAQRSLGVYLVHPLVLLAAGRLVQSGWLPLNFAGPFILTLCTLLVVVAVVVLLSQAMVGWLAWLPGGWLLGWRREARTRRLPIGGASRIPAT